MGIVVTLLPDQQRLQRLRAAVRDRHKVIAAASWAELTMACETQPAHVAVLDLYADGAVNFERIRTLQSRFPRLALVAYVTLTPERARDMFDAGRVGMDGLVVADLDDAPATLLAHVDRAEARGAASHVRQAIGSVRQTVKDAVLASVTRAHERLTPDSLSRLLGTPRRVLARRLADAGFPAPHRLITWGRLVVAGHLLEEPSRSADSVAFALDFPSGSAFRNTCQRYLHATPQQIRARGGAEFVVRALLQQTRPPSGAQRRGTRSAVRLPRVAV